MRWRTRTCDPRQIETGIARSNRWQSLLLARGLLDATPRAGHRVKRIEISPGLTATVVADKHGDCEVTLETPMWQDEQWTSAIDSLSRQALFAAQMLAGDFPDALEATLQAEGLSLLPVPVRQSSHPAPV